MNQAQTLSGRDRLRPVQTDTISAYPLDTDLVLHDERDGQSYALNHTGRVIWDRCTGEMTMQTIARDIAALFAIPPEQACADTLDLLAELADAGMITWSSPDTSVVD